MTFVSVPHFKGIGVPESLAAGHEAQVGSSRPTKNLKKP